MLVGLVMVTYTLECSSGLILTDTSTCLQGTFLTHLYLAQQLTLIEQWLV